MVFIDPKKLRLCLEPDAQICLNCKHFFLHYRMPSLKTAKSEGVPSLIALFEGDCTYSQTEIREVVDTCEHFQRYYDELLTPRKKNTVVNHDGIPDSVKECLK